MRMAPRPRGPRISREASFTLIIIISTKMTSEAVAEKVWNGLIHVRIFYESLEYLLDAKRILYFPVYYPRIIDYFHAASGSGSGNLRSNPVWLEYEDVPIKWNLPIGLLYDLLYLPSKSNKSEVSTWNLQLRVASNETPYPSQHIIPFPSNGDCVGYEKMLNQVFINSLKQACYVANGNARSVMNLSEDDTYALWRAMAKHDMGVFSSVRNKVNLPLRGARQRVPVKLYVAGSASLLQAPVWSQDENAMETTLVRAVSQHISGISPGNLPHLYIHGINVDVLHDEPILEVWDRFRFLDNFLYIVIVMQE